MKPTKTISDRTSTLHRTALIAGLGYGVGIALALFLATSNEPVDAATSRPATIAPTTNTTEASGATPEILERIAHDTRVGDSAEHTPKKRRRLPRDFSTPPRIANEPVFQPRPENEWQGMLVDVSAQSTCESVGGCGLAMACLDGRICGPCQGDGDCAGGEACVLDHCVQESKVECRSESQCDGGQVCILTGYSDGVRGNEDMSARCESTEGPAPSDEIDALLALPEEPMPLEPRPVSVADLRDSLMDG